MSDCALIVRSGSGRRRVPLVPPGPLLVGRMPEHPICLAEDHAVSRRHAELRGDRLPQGDIRWSVRDLGSRHGTRLNGFRLPPDKLTPLEPGDEIVMGSTHLEFSTGKEADSATISAPLLNDDEGAAGGATLVADEASRTDLARMRFELLLELGEQLHAATGRRELGQRIVEVAAQATGLPNVALLSGVPGTDDEVRVLASCGRTVDGHGRLGASRSMIRGAADGNCMTFGGVGMHGSQSLIGLGVSEAVCVPLLDGGEVSHLLYADRRGTPGGGVSGDAVAFLSVLARFGAMALQSIHRAELAARWKSLELDLSIAASAQRMLLRDHRVRIGPLSIEVRSRSGREVGGDFFVVARHGERVRLVLGDVSGKGVGASVLMAALKGFVEAELTRHDALEAVVLGMHNFIVDHRDGDRFVTAWLAELDPSSGKLRYIDAGHGHAVKGDDRSGIWLDEAGGPIIGPVPDAIYATAATTLAPGDRLLILSDGLIEQPEPDDPTRSERSEFGRARVESWLLDPRPRDLDGLFSTVHAFAGSDRLDDDATAILVEADPPG